MMIEQVVISVKNKEKQQECISQEVKNMPRKKKKRVRKLLNKDYQFWLQMDRWHKSLFL